MKRKIVADSSCDIFEVTDIPFQSVPLTISTDERSFVDDEKLDINEMLDYLQKYNGRSFTACPSVEAWLSAFAGAEEIFVVTITSNLSGAFNSANTAAQLYKESNPDCKIHIFDTYSTGPEMRMLIEKLAELAQTDKSFEKICQEAGKYLKFTRLFFALESFRNLANNGRINKTVAKLAGVLGIRIVATASREGTIEITDKCRGERNTVRAFLSHLKEAGFTGGKVYIAHCKNNPFAETVSNAIKGLYPKAKIKIYELRGLCSFYAEKGGLLLGCECNKAY